MGHLRGAAAPWRGNAWRDSDLADVLSTASAGGHTRRGQPWQHCTAALGRHDVLARRQERRALLVIKGAALMPRAAWCR